MDDLDYIESRISELGAILFAHSQIGISDYDSDSYEAVMEKLSAYQSELYQLEEQREDLLFLKRCQNDYDGYDPWDDEVPFKSSFLSLLGGFKEGFPHPFKSR